MTNQEAFDIVYVNALKQNERSEKNGQCLYRGPNGLKCFAGFLIDDSEYIPEFEDESIFVSYHNLHKLFVNKGLNIEFIHKLRTIHDESYPQCWQKELTEFAVQEGLTVPE